MAHSLVENDPFIAEGEQHGDDLRRLSNEGLRDLIRSRINDCDRCAALIDAFDIELSRALINGTGPWS